MRISIKIFFTLALLLVVESKQINTNSASVEHVKETSSVSNGLTRILGEFDELVRHFLDYFLSSPIREDTLLLLRKTVTRLSRSLEKFGAKILDAAEEVTKDIFSSLKQRLSTLEEDFKDLSRLTDEKFERLIIYVNETMMEQSLHMESWAFNLKRQLRSMNDTAIYRKVCPAIDALIKETTDELSGCCNIVIKPVRSICRSVRTILRETFEVVADVVETLENCIFSEEKFDSMVISCLEDIYDDVSALMDRVAALRHTLMTKLPTKILLSNFCISMVSVTMATRKSDVEQQIGYLNN